ncbi:MAG: MFS transporter, partial [Thermodesulfobacteriota bacterium]|nr:MFS transporter [Thermodesulfobacteriota bacterium]
ALVAILIGFNNTIDMPTRQSFYIDLVGKDDLMNAISLNSAVFNLARMIGPAVAGFLMASFGIATSFYINAFGYIAVMIALLLISTDGEPQELPNPASSIINDIKEGITYIKQTQLVRQVMLLLGTISLFAMNFWILIPVYAKHEMHQNIKGFGIVTASMGVGALIGALIIASISYLGPKIFFIIFGAFGTSISQVLLYFTHSYHTIITTLIILGLSSIFYLTSTNTTIQLMVPDNLRGRIMSIFTLLMLGIMPIGSLFAGSIANKYGSPLALLIGGCGGIVATTFFARSVKKAKKQTGNQ